MCRYMVGVRGGRMGDRVLVPDPATIFMVEVLREEATAIIKI